MTTDLPWEPTRWRGIQQLNSSESVDAPPHSASTDLERTAPKVDLDSYLQATDKISRMNEDQQAQTLPSLTASHGNVSTRSLGRHSPSADGGYGPWRLKKFPEHTSSWQSLRYDHEDRRNEGHIAGPLLSLHIPKSQSDLRATLPGYTTTSSEEYSSKTSSSRSQKTTSLPSFAAFREHANLTNDSSGIEFRPMSARGSCQACNELAPIVRDVAIVVAELDEGVQTACNRPSTRKGDCPVDNPIHAAHWILDRLRCTQRDLQSVIGGSQLNYGYQHISNALPSLTARGMSPSNSLKRRAERWEHEEGSFPKRSRPDLSFQELPNPISASASAYRRASIDFIIGDQSRTQGFSPPVSESVSASADPRTISPAPTTHPTRALPSPSSTTYPPSAAPSLPAQTAQSVDSPATSYQPSMSIHTASTDSATSTHIAELQHQVTLKSLRLQTLQTEYSSLLQKLQRLNVKTQTMERKSQVADQEVNELTTKNEDLNQEVQSLQEQLEESERRREREREDSGKEKDQWLQMLEQTRRIQGKYEDDKKILSRQITSLQAEKEQLRESHIARSHVRHDDVGNAEERPSQESSLPENQSFISPSRSGTEKSKEIASLKANVEALRFSLEEIRRHNQVMEERAHDVIRNSGQLRSAIESALDHDQSAGRAERPEPDRGRKPQTVQLTRSWQESTSPTQRPRSEVGSSTRAQTESLVPMDPDSDPSSAVDPGTRKAESRLDQLAAYQEELNRAVPWLSTGPTAPRYQAAAFTTAADHAPQRVPSIATRGDSFRTANYRISALSTDTADDTEQEMASPRSRQGSLGSARDSSSTSTRVRDSQSPEGSLAEAEPQFGAELTPMSTLPTPMSAGSTQQLGRIDSSESYFRQTQNVSDKDMPPPPRPVTQTTEYGSTTRLPNAAPE